MNEYKCCHRTYQTVVRVSEHLLLWPSALLDAWMVLFQPWCNFVSSQIIPWCQKNAKIHVREIIQELHEIADLQQQKILILMWNLLVYNIQKKTNFSITNYIATLLVIINQQRRSEYRLFITSCVPVLFYYVIITLLCFSPIHGSFQLCYVWKKTKLKTFFCYLY